MNREPRSAHLTLPAHPTRRRMLIGMGAVPAAWALAPLAAHAADDTTPGLLASPKQTEKAECLADLIEQGVVDRADLVAR